MSHGDIQQGWTQDGTFKDANGDDVRCYDVVALLEAAASEPDPAGSVAMLPAGTSGTVLFYKTGQPCWLELEYETDRRIFGIVEATKTKLHLRSEEKYPR
ncbi:hypothetical protein ABC955_01965 [Citromicrobium bathyomarinum]|uniref:hypothetical protein n=1 Tax=Citromicrobium TaxID=72173 RepID=UPI0001DD0997|nr:MULTISPECIES: hypothetical protein [Citromicrobium]ALG59967.1 hypothetical protein WG74_03185 [Citromicrobium sp. JL477]KPM16553.1 hypothetical protein VM77_10535 [Citromicrobium sp. JL31]KPM18581.1 hypothetical protein VO58_00215 [Citromicrobium sp. JL1351]KPM29571.1 hypothetical protein VO57_00215 [Citromicrobium sp. JL2201]